MPPSSPVRVEIDRCRHRASCHDHRADERERVCGEFGECLGHEREHEIVVAIELGSDLVERAVGGAAERDRGDRPPVLVGFRDAARPFVEAIDTSSDGRPTLAWVLERHLPVASLVDLQRQARFVVNGRLKIYQPRNAIFSDALRRASVPRWGP